MIPQLVVETESGSAWLRHVTTSRALACKIPALIFFSFILFQFLVSSDEQIVCTCFDRVDWVVVCTFGSHQWPLRWVDEATLLATFAELLFRPNHLPIHPITSNKQIKIIVRTRIISFNQSRKEIKISGGDFNSFSLSFIFFCCFFFFLVLGFCFVLLIGVGQC